MNPDVAQIILKQNFEILRKLEDLEQNVKNLEEVNCILAELVRKKIDEQSSVEEKASIDSEEVERINNNDMRYDEDDNRDTRFTGTVKWFDRLKGFGFIHATKMNIDVYVHMTSIQSFLRFLYTGEPVEFEIQSQNGRLSAINVKKLNEIETKDTDQPRRSRRKTFSGKKRVEKRDNSRSSDQ